jgi:Glycosyltransferase family 28 C-terminal domain/Monogalactosyldiacylglycerol (MGDG) synthase
MIAPVTGRDVPEVVLFILDAGGGHRSAAKALVAAAETQGRPWVFRVVNLQDVLAPLDFGRRLTGQSMEQTYNGMIRRRQTWFLVPLLRVFQWLIRLRRSTLCDLLATHLGERPPRLVISLIPNFNGVIRDAVRRCLPKTPFFVLLTDFADFPPRFWMEPGLDRVIVGSERAVAQARQIGLPAERVTRTSGMVLHPRFYPPPGPDVRARVRRELRLAEGAFVVLVLFGGKGSPEMRPLSEALLDASPDLVVIAVCGDNPPLYDTLAGLEARSGGRLHRLGFTDRVSEYLSACDVLVTKPGPGSLAEAFHQHVPVIVASNAHTIPQERYNAALVRDGGLGLTVRGWRDIPAAVMSVRADAQRLDGCRTRLAALPPNRAVFEVLDLVEAELASADRPPVAYEFPRGRVGDGSSQGTDSTQ